MFQENFNQYERSLFYCRKEHPFGVSWEEWCCRWWKWALSIPRESNPGIDSTGEKYFLNPQWESVIFLVGTFGGRAQRSYKIPGGKSIFLPIINFETSFNEEPYLQSEEDLLSRVRRDIDDIIRRELIIDGNRVVNLDAFRITTDVFDLILPEDNVFGVKPGFTRAASDGYWAFLKPLPLGQHTIRASGACSSGKTTVDITWQITVEQDQTSNYR